MNTSVIASLQIAGIGILLIFLFMLLFYLAIRAIIKIFPWKESETES
ncbi:MAG TPA: hypothetical protein PKU85_03375 [Bacteroidales bacterium]|nr:MAG: hypothetical protein BWX62_00732 [Bacteroidetes bacterium ADurb.Bin037]HPV88239.1 hypothetical protein [Bacteroidales bacterium]HPW78284.1 hypothetical protein [Bacteroidales bacterium]HQB56113.1 hypothetical protein [Bacteroidales bacterium]